MSTDESAVVQIFEALDLEVLWCNFNVTLLESRECVEQGKVAAAPTWEGRGSFLLISNVEAETNILDLIDLFPNIFICLLQVLIQAGNTTLNLMRSQSSLWNTEKMVGCGLETVDIWIVSKHVCLEKNRCLHLQLHSPCSYSSAVKVKFWLTFEFPTTKALSSGNDSMNFRCSLCSHCSLGLFMSSWTTGSLIKTVFVNSHHQNEGKLDLLPRKKEFY